MNTLVKHLWDCNREQIIERSRLHCHARGLHSIMLLEQPGKTIRLFVTTPGHEMQHNFPASPCPMSIAFHPHHCDLTLEVVKGTILNWTVLASASTGDGIDMKRFRYQSAITNTAGKFTNEGVRRLFTHEEKELKCGDSLAMRAYEMHTVAVREDEIAAWFVYEGRENAHYNSVCYSNADLEQFDFSRFYKRTNEVTLLALLRSVNMI